VSTQGCLGARRERRSFSGAAGPRSESPPPTATPPGLDLGEGGQRRVASHCKPSDAAVFGIAQKENLGLTLACAWPWSQNISSQFRLDTPKQAMSREGVDLIELELARIALYGAVPNRTLDPNAYLVDPVAQACEPLPEQVLQQWGYTIAEPVVAVIERGTCLDTVKVRLKSRASRFLRDEGRSVGSPPEHAASSSTHPPQYWLTPHPL